MQIKWASGQLKIMTSGPVYIAESSVWWEEGVKAELADGRVWC